MNDDTFNEETVRLALRRMFNGNYFDICVVRRCLDAAGCVAPSDQLDALAPLHCVEWGDMTPAMRDQVLRRTLDLFAHPRWELTELDIPLVEDPDTYSPSLFRRLLR